MKHVNAKVVGKVELKKVFRPNNKKPHNSVISLNEAAGVHECAAKLRSHGVVIDGKKKLIKNPKNLGLRLLGKLDFLKRHGFEVLS